MPETSEKTVLVVDDEKDVVLFLGAVLEQAGYRVVGARNTAEALELVHRQRPDLICLDVLMPGESGVSLFRKLRRDSRLRDVPVIVTSGLSVSRDLQSLRSLRLEDGSLLPPPEAFVEKPIDPDLFLAKAREVLGR